MITARDRNRLMALGDEYREMLERKSDLQRQLAALNDEMDPVRRKMEPLIVRALADHELTLGQIADMAGYGQEESIRKIARAHRVAPRRAGRKTHTEPNRGGKTA